MKISKTVAMQDKLSQQTLSLYGPTVSQWQLARYLFLCGTLRQVRPPLPMNLAVGNLNLSVVSLVGSSTDHQCGSCCCYSLQCTTQRICAFCSWHGFDPSALLVVVILVNVTSLQILQILCMLILYYFCSMLLTTTKLPPAPCCE